MFSQFLTSLISRKSRITSTELVCSKNTLLIQIMLLACFFLLSGCKKDEQVDPPGPNFPPGGGRLVNSDALFLNQTLHIPGLGIGPVTYDAQLVLLNQEIDFNSTIRNHNPINDIDIFIVVILDLEQGLRDNNSTFGLQNYEVNKDNSISTIQCISSNIPSSQNRSSYLIPFRAKVGKNTTENISIHINDYIVTTQQSLRANDFVIKEFHLWHLSPEGLLYNGTCSGGQGLEVLFVFDQYNTRSIGLNWSFN